MGAGSQTDHYIQDATEQDLVYRVQELLVRDNFAVTDNVEIKKKEFDDRLIDKKIVSLYASSDYKKCLDKNLIKVYNALISHRPGIKFDIVWIGKDGRNESKKGDIIAVYEDGVIISYSLKVYKEGIASIQVRSGTYNSTFLSIILKDYALPQVGMYSNPIPKNEWKSFCKTAYKDKFNGGKSLKIRDAVLQYLGLEDAIEVLHQLDQIKIDSINRFKNDSTTRNIFSEGVKDAWENQCYVAGHSASSLIVKYLKDKAINLKSFALKQVGFSGDEELIALSETECLVSTSNLNYQKVVSRCLSQNCILEYNVRGKGIGFVFRDNDGDIIEINMPFTLNKNGAWWQRVAPFEGKRPYPGRGKDAGTLLEYGEWRPQKSQEMATSTNTYVELKKAGVFDAV
jgi:hypothetical protein